MKQNPNHQGSPTEAFKALAREQGKQQKVNRQLPASYLAQSKKGY